MGPGPREGEAVPSNSAQTSTSLVQQGYAWVKNVSTRTRHAMGLKTWKTSSYEVWLMLQTQLYLVRPRTLFELGSGRSTSYLAEYAFKMGAQLLSIDEHRLYTRKTNRVLRDSFLPHDLVRHVPLRDNWYDAAVVNRLLDQLDAPIDFILVDGPSRFGGGDRGDRAFGRHVLPRLGAIELAVVDDVNRAECDATARQIQEAHALERFDMAYGGKAAIAFLSSKRASKRLRALPPFLAEMLKPAGSFSVPPTT